MKNKILSKSIIYLAASLFLIGCGGVKKEEHESCIPEVTIQSTNDIIFYFIEASDYKYYASLKNPSITNNYLCFHDKIGHSLDQCNDYAEQGYVKTYVLPAGTKIVLDGFVAKTVKWGFEAIDTGPSPTTWFRGKVNGKTIWVTSHQIEWMFESESNFKVINQKTYELLNLGKRMPPPIESESDGSANMESFKRHYEIQEKEISNWNCNI